MPLSKLSNYTFGLNLQVIRLFHSCDFVSPCTWASPCCVASVAENNGGQGARVQTAPGSNWAA